MPEPVTTTGMQLAMTASKIRRAEGVSPATCRQYRLDSIASA